VCKQREVERATKNMLRPRTPRRLHDQPSFQYTFVSRDFVDAWLWRPHFHKLDMRRRRAAERRLDAPDSRLAEMRHKSSWPGPSPHPQSMWPSIVEYAAKFGGIYRTSKRS